MTRKKIISAFVTVWLTICVSYMGVRTAMAALTNSQTITSADAEVASSATEQNDLSEQEERTGLGDPTEQVWIGGSEHHEREREVFYVGNDY